MNYRIKQSRLRNLTVIGLLGAAGLALSTNRASAQIEGADILYRYNGTTIVAGPQEPGTPVSELFNRQIGQPFPGADFENDTGMDVFPGFDAGYVGPNGEGFQFRKLTIQEVSISPGLSAFYQFDGVTPVFGALNDPTFIHYWELTENKITDPNDPFYKALQARGATQISAGADANGVENYFHQHFIFNAAVPGNYDFTYKITGATLLDGTVLSDSDLFTIHYTPVTDVPEPGTVALLVASSLPIVGLLRRRRRA